LAENCGYDAIVLDLMLPRLDGWQVLERLRRAKSTLCCCWPPAIPS
jgi:DNA-binding response OmpR family regulator